jgi:quercetin dioxygenase-like cupin family protein
MACQSVRFAISASFVLFLSSTALAADSDKTAVGLEAKEILKTTQTVVGGSLKYPASGVPEVSSAIVTIQPGGHTALHQHPVVTVVCVLEGEAELHVGEKVFHYKAGDSWVEPIDTPNQLFNPGSVPTKNLVVFVGEQGKPNSIMVH